MTLPPFPLPDALEGLALFSLGGFIAIAATNNVTDPDSFVWRFAFGVSALRTLRALGQFPRSF